MKKKLYIKTVYQKYFFFLQKLQNSTLVDVFAKNLNLL